MFLDVVVATFRRPHLLRRTLQSLCAAELPGDVHPRIVVVDNDPELTGASAIHDLAAQAPIPVTILQQPEPGKSNALNRGIAELDGDYVGFVDDDEEVHPAWFQVIGAAVAAKHPDFLGGPCVPLWMSSVPDWLPGDYPAVLGLVDNGPRERRYQRGQNWMLSGGNAVIARRMLERVGEYSPLLGPRDGCRLFSSEDEEMYLRLIEADAQGWYLPQLIVYHHVHENRLSKRYYRRWCFWNGASKSVLARAHPWTLPRIAGVPRHLYRRAARNAVAMLKPTMMPGSAARRFAAELSIWELAGHLYGHHFYRPPSRAGRRAAASRVERTETPVR